MKYIEIPNDGIVSVPIMIGDDVVGEKQIDLNFLPCADVESVRHECNCETIHGFYTNIYSIEIDSKHSEIAIWEENKCLAIFHANYCPNCGAKMGGRK